MKMDLVEMDPSAVVTGPCLRQKPGDLTTLENSIKRLGLLFPIIVGRNNMLISGSRRLQACRNIGMDKIYALKVDVPAGSMVATDIQSEENICRNPLSPAELEVAIGFKSSSSARERASLSLVEKLMRSLGIRGGSRK